LRFPLQELERQSMTEVCANIGPRGIRQRMMGGVYGLIVTVAILVLLVVMHAPRPSRLWLVFPLFLSAVGFFQARAKTCVALALAGKRDADTGDEITERERPIIQRQMVGVLARSAIAAVVVTALLYLV
jgi:hypothetical protein